MKTRFKLQTQSFAVPTRAFSLDVASHQSQTVEVPGVAIEGDVECTVQELKELWALKKEILTDFPTILGNLGLQLIDVVNAVEAKKNQSATDDTVCEEDIDAEETNDVAEEETEEVFMPQCPSSRE